MAVVSTPAAIELENPAFPLAILRIPAAVL
jgi:hypothetical protein